MGIDFIWYMCFPKVKIIIDTNDIWKYQWLNNHKELSIIINDKLDIEIRVNIGNKKSVVINLANEP